MTKQVKLPRRWGSGSVEEYTPGKFRVRTRIDGKLATVGTGLSEATAQRYADALNSVREDKAKMTMRVMVELARIDRQRRDDLKTSTVRREQSTLTHIATGLGSIPVSEIQPRDIRDYLKSAKAVSTQRNRLNLIRYVLQMAVDDDLIIVNVADSVKLKRGSSRLKKSDLLNELLWPYHQQAIIDVMGSARFSLSELPAKDQLSRDLLLASYLFALGTGCRLSEQWGIKREDVSEDAILISRSVGNETPKSGDWREVPILPPTSAALRVLARVRKQSRHINRSEWLFPGFQGGQRQWSKQPLGWGKALKVAKVGHRSWHWLRHTTATALLGGWWGEAWTLEQVRALLGHASVTTTEIYAQLLDDSAFKAAEKSFQKRSRKRDIGEVDFEAV